jgi:carbonic anhydrase
MLKLLQGIQRFRRDFFPARAEHFAGLAQTNKPSWMLIVCSDGRLVPEQKFGVEPGDMYTVRTAGYAVPKCGKANLAAQANIKLGLKLGARDIVVLGHTDCGAMKALVNPSLVSDIEGLVETLTETGTSADWVKHITDPREAADELTKLHIVQQLDNVMTYPQVAEGVASGEMRLYGLLFDISRGAFLLYNPEAKAFECVEERAAAAAAAVQLLGGHTCCHHGHECKAAD